MSIREAELPNAAAMARVTVDSYRAAHRAILPEKSLTQLTYEESERNWARTIRELDEAEERQEHIYIAESDEGLIIGRAMGEKDQLRPSPLYRGNLSPVSAPRVASSRHRADAHHQRNANCANSVKLRPLNPQSA